jgi:hypothetical protein
MAVKSVIVYWPWGAGGNLVKNICTLDTDFDWFDQHQYRPAIPPTQDERYHFLLDYYSESITPALWLEREWSIRGRYLAKYYDNNCIQYWDPEWTTAYECHGQIEEIDRIMDSAPLKIFDRTRVDRAEIPDQFSNWHLNECRHVFLLPKDLHLITDIYQSKNPDLNQINPNGTAESRRKQAYIINRLMTLRLTELADTLQEQQQQVYKYTADDLFNSTGHQLLHAMVSDLQLDIPLDKVQNTHSAWWSSTQQVYKQYWDKELP